MKHTIQLQVPEPCHQNWNSMEALGQGRFCLSCQKQVIDFTAMTDADILRYMSAASSNTCGRFSAVQLHRDMTPALEPRKMWWSYWMSLAASFVMLTSRSAAQTKVWQPVVSVPRINEIVVGKVSVPSIPNPDSSVTGIITDETNSPVAGAVVMVKGTKTGAVASENGIFHLTIKENKNTVLRVSAAGYESQEITVPAKSNLPVLELKLMAAEVIMTGEVVIVKNRSKSIFGLFKKDSAVCKQLADAFSMQVFPNPVMKGAPVTLNVHHLPAGTYTVAVYDALGTIKKEKQIVVAGKKVKEYFNMAQDFASGNYVLTLTGSNKNMHALFIVL